MCVVVCTLSISCVKLCLYVLFVAFSENETGEISAGLEQYLESIAATGQTLYASFITSTTFSIYLIGKVICSYLELLW